MSEVTNIKNSVNNRNLTKGITRFIEVLLFYKELRLFAMNTLNLTQNEGQEKRKKRVFI